MSDKEMNIYPDISSVAVVGNFLPRKCGIATFTTDLVNALNSLPKDFGCETIVMNDRPEGYDYPDEVRFEISDENLKEYHTAAQFMNIRQPDIVSLQHEFGIFGGQDGSHILELLRDIKIPILTTLHTVLAEPSKGQREVMEQLAELSDRLIVMSKTAVDILHSAFDIPEKQVVYIPHGIPDMPFVDPNYYKDKFDLLGQKVLLTFGLLSENKGIEYVIKSLPAILEKFPELTYVVVGSTHPNVLEHEGEKYRNKLEGLVDDLDLHDHVQFENRFVSYDELCDYLASTDIYITPYNNEEQITSGTLAYAAGTGKAVISTPYWYASEMLADGRGELVPFRDEDAMADAVIDLFSNEAKRHQMRKRSYDFNRSATWDGVAGQYMETFQSVKSDYEEKPRASQHNGNRHNRSQMNGDTPLPPLKIDHLKTLSDSTGLLQHANHTIAKRDHGYCTDDNARGLIVAAQAKAIPQISDADAKKLDTLSDRYLAFILHAYDSASGRFRNFMDYSREWKEQVGSEDSHARALWALGITASLSKNGPHLPLTSTLFMRGLDASRPFHSPRGIAFTLIGIDNYLNTFAGDAKAWRIGEELAERLLQRFKGNSSDDWPWPEDILSYSNGKLPHSLISAGQRFHHDEMIQMGMRSLSWLIEIQTTDGHLSPIGNKGWFRRNEEKARFDQQPLEADALLEACIAAYNLTDNELWLKRARMCFSWFLGNNDVKLPLYNSGTGGCRDGLMSNKVNQNEGAESTLAWMLSLTAMYKLMNDEIIQLPNTSPVEQ